MDIVYQMIYFLIFNIPISYGGFSPDFLGLKQAV